MAESYGRQFFHIFEQSPIGIVVMDANGRIQYVNERVRQFLGYSGEEIRGGFLSRYASADDSTTFQQLFGELVDGDRESFRIFGRCRVRSGADAWWRVDARAIRPESGVPYLIATVDDVTLQKNDEHELRRAKEVAESATRTKSAFLANMSHEIRTPLHTINGMADLMRETNLDEEQLEYLGQIQFAGEVLLSLINDILDFSKIEAGRLQLETIEFEPVTTIEEAVDMVSMQAHKKALEVLLSMADRIPRTIHGDPNRIRQVLVNLVNNAVKFTHNGWVRIAVGLRERNGTQMLLVQVQDTGIGIPPERQNRLFQPFSQVDSSMTRKYGGTGLGLSISRDLVEMMGGRIGVKSKPGIGSNFWFTIPLDRPDWSDSAVTPPEGVPDGCRCLIVDDNRESIKIVATYLAEWSIAAVHAPDGASGMSMLREAVAGGTPFDIALIDLRLPNMDGWQFASELRNDPLLAEMPLVLMSPIGSSSGEAKMKLLRWFNAYISKPVKRRELADGLSRAFGGDIEELEAVAEEAAGRIAGLSAELPRTVLVAEDHYVNQQLFQTILSKKGFDTIVANDGLEAVEIVRSNRDVGLVFMDVQMPNLNGFDATVRIRDLGFNVPIVAVTANALSGDRDRCFRVGMNDYISKPFRSTDIDDVLRRLATNGMFSVEDSVEEVEMLEPLESLEPIEAADMDGTGGASPEPPPIDLLAATEAFMGDTATVERVVRTFTGKLELQLTELSEMLDEGKVAEARVLSHAIKGGAWNLSCPDLGAAAKAVEDACAAEDAERATVLLGPLGAEALRLERYVGTVDFAQALDVPVG